MYKAYQSILPCQSRILKQRWDEKYYLEHRAKVHEAAPMVDTKPPRTYVHLHLKLKKMQLEEERLATIERDNRILLEKMSQVMRTRGRVDNINNYQYKSLNREKRQRELLRVTRENQEILKRVMAREPELNHLKWEQEWHKNEEFMDNIARFPKNWWDMEQKERKLRFENKKKMMTQVREKREKREKKQGNETTRSIEEKKEATADEQKATTDEESDQQEKKTEEPQEEEKVEEGDKE